MCQSKILLRTVLVTVLLVLYWAVPIVGQENVEILTTAQTLQRYRISDLQLSPDEKRIAMVVTEPVKGSARNQDIWIYEVASEQLLRYTTSEKTDYRPRWSPDGQTLAFLSNRIDQTQIFFLSMKGGEAEEVTKSETSIRSFEWSPDGTKIVYMASEPKTEEEKEKQADKDDARVIDQHGKPARLWTITLDTRETKQLSDGEWRISSYTWMPHGDKLILSATDINHPELETNRIFSMDLPTKELVEIASPAHPFTNIKPSPDGNYIAYCGTRVDGPTAHDLYIMDSTGQNPKNLTVTSVDNPIGNYIWLKSGVILSQVSKGFNSVFYEVFLNGNSQKIKSYISPTGSFVIGKNFAAYVGETTVRAPELYISRKPGTATQVTHFNSQWDSIGLILPEFVSYVSFDETEIGAALLTPRDYEPGKKIPAIILVHGGPAGRWSDRFNSWAQLLAARGYAVLCPNIRGSTGYGHDFMTSNKADWGGGDYQDVMAGLDYLIESGIADPERVGVGGWSYGGYMAAWIVTQTDRFQASVSGAPMTDLAFEYGAEIASINAYDTWYMGTPYENLDLFIARSPMTFVKNVITPTLILCGENDLIDPVEQCQMFYRGLKRYGVDTEFVIYPREGHGIREEKHQIDMLNRIIDWYDKYLK